MKASTDSRLSRDDTALGLGVELDLHLHVCTEYRASTIQIQPASAYMSPGNEVLRRRRKENVTLCQRRSAKRCSVFISESSEYRADIDRQRCMICICAFGGEKFVYIYPERSSEYSERIERLCGKPSNRSLQGCWSGKLRIPKSQRCTRFRPKAKNPCTITYSKTLSSFQHFDCSMGP